jgi:hypothetical protein
MERNVNSWQHFQSSTMFRLGNMSRRVKGWTITYFSRCPNASIISVKQSLTHADVYLSTRCHETEHMNLSATLNLKTISKVFNYDGISQTVPTYRKWWGLICA